MEPYNLETVVITRDSYKIETSAYDLIVIRKYVTSWTLINQRWIRVLSARCFASVLSHSIPPWLGQ